MNKELSAVPLMISTLSLALLQTISVNRVRQKRTWFLVSSVALLFSANLVHVTKVCVFVRYKLPFVLRAVNLRTGIWFVLSPTANFGLLDSVAKYTPHLFTEGYPGCRISIRTLLYGYQLLGTNIFIRSDLELCSKVPSIKIHVDRPV